MPRGYPPSVFVSSTCYDLAQIRLDLKNFIEGLGYDAVISEAPNFPVNPQATNTENCIAAVRDRADVLVLVVGTRYGTVPAGTKHSITNLEYLEAKAKQIPTYVFLARQIIHTLPVWKRNPAADYSSIVDTPQLFAFADELRSDSGTWVFGFADAADIIGVLRQQWALLFTDALETRQKFRAASLAADLADLPAQALSILLERPTAWEHRFFTSVLRRELSKLVQLRLDVKYAVHVEPAQLLDETLDALDWINGQFARAVRLTDSAERLLNDAIQQGLGPPGVPGDPSLLAYVARRIAGVVGALLEWQRQFRTAIVKPVFSRLFELASATTNEAITKLEGLPDLIDSEIDKAIEADSRGEHYIADARLTIGTETGEFLAEMRRVEQEICR